MKAPLFDRQGKRTGEVELAADLFEAVVNVPLVHQKVVMERNAQRQGTHDTKGRSEIQATTKKPYRQKGTGRARQGSVAAPHYRHGGVVFGPTPRDHSQKMPKKMRRAAFFAALSGKAASGDLLVIDEFSLTDISTRSAALLLDSMEVTGKAMVLVAENDQILYKSLRNIPGVELRTVNDVSTLDVANGGQIVITKDALQKLQEVRA